MTHYARIRIALRAYLDRLNRRAEIKRLARLRMLTREIH